MSAKRTLNTLDKNSKALSKSLKKVASGMKINSAGDDASGLSISERMRVQIRALDQANTNAQNAGSLLQTAEGAASSTVDILKTLKEKAIDAANDTNTDIDRATIQKEIDQSIDQISDNANVTFNGMKIFTGDADATSDVEDTIIKALNSDWLKTSLDMIQDAYGINFTDGNASVTEMDVKLENITSGAQANALAFVSSEAQGGVTSKLTLTINMAYYNTLNKQDPNGSSKTTSAYLDRTIAHEMTHAAMRANIKNMSSMPSYAREGLAEVTHGIDDERKDKLQNLTPGSTLDWTSGNGQMYATGYAFMRFIATQSGNGINAIQNMMSVLVNKGGDAYNAAISAATNGKYATGAAAQQAFKDAMDSSTSAEDFLKKYCNIDLNNIDTGSILGSDANTGEEKSAESVVLEGLNTKFWYFPSGSETMINGLTVKWPNFTAGDGLKFQVGTKANQVIRSAFSDISAEGLGLKADDGKTLSVGTRTKATQAITILDNAITKVLHQQTTIGAIESRLQYTSANLTTASENTTGAESVIRDADMAKEMTEYTKNNVLMQSAQSMLAQANQNSSQILSLLQ